MVLVLTQSSRRRPNVLLLVRLFAFFFLTCCRPLAVVPGAYGSPWVLSQSEEDPLHHASVPRPSELVMVLSKRSSTSSIIHDEFFIPGVAASGGMVIIALLCCYALWRTKQRSKIPGPGQLLPYTPHYKPPTAVKQSERSDGAMAAPPSEVASINTGRFSSRQSKIQRKSMLQPSYGIDPLPQPPASESNSYFQRKSPVPGVPQHPGLAIYNPEPLPYANGATQMRNVAPSGAAGAHTSRNREQDVPIPVPAPRPRATPYPSPRRPQSPLSDDQSVTQVGSASPLSYSSAQRINRAQAPYQPPPREGGSSFAVPAPNPPSPPAQLPPANIQQPQPQLQRPIPTAASSSSALSYLSSERAQRFHAQQTQAQYQPPPPDGASSFAVPAHNPPSPPAQLQPAAQQQQYRYADQYQQGRDQANYQQGWSGTDQPPQYTATKSSHHSRREHTGSSRGG